MSPTGRTFPLTNLRENRKGRARRRARATRDRKVARPESVRRGSIAFPNHAWIRFVFGCPLPRDPFDGAHDKPAQRPAMVSHDREQLRRGPATGIFARDL